MAGWTSIWHSGFSNSEELNEAWHDVAGYGQVLSSAEMTALVHQHPEFASRCANTDRSFFFGPAKEQLWYVVDWEYRRPALLRQHAGACDCCTLEEPSRAASCTSSPTMCYTDRIATATVDVMLRGTGLPDDQRAACHSNLNACGLASNPAPVPPQTTPSPSAPAGGLIYIYV